MNIKLPNSTDNNLELLLMKNDSTHKFYMTLLFMSLRCRLAQVKDKKVATGELSGFWKLGN